jgi:hypothetical protein
MIAMDVRLSDRSNKFLVEQARKFPREVRRAFYYACGVALRNMRSMMDGKTSKRRKNNLAKWDDFTRQFRAKQSVTWPPASKFGGKLMFPDNKQLTMQPEGDRVRIGWIGALEEAARRFQDGGSEATTKEWRHWRYVEGFPHGAVPQVANTPPRPVIEIVANDMDKHIDDITLGAPEKIFLGKIKYWETRYKKSAWTREGARAAKYASAFAGAYEQARMR